MNKKLVIGLAAVLGLITALTAFDMLSREAIDYNAEIKPILNKHCISCHGGVKKSGGFSLLFREDALSPTQSGVSAIIPGSPDESEMIRRLTAHDPEERMPYKKAPLSDEDIKKLRRWVSDGAPWGQHWAYTTVEETPPPVARSFWNLFGLVPEHDMPDMDRFVADKQRDLDALPSPPADNPTLLRRVSFDLTGLPPAPELAARFLAEENPIPYEALVDSLLNSPSYGEHWAAMWLDLARYADTKGYERDDVREIWHYRDWIIKALNRDMPYDRFLLEQLAGDLLPDPTDAQYIATAFHRNTMTNDEGGTDNEEFRVAAVLDRVNTTWEGLMGTTFACVQCHGHPFDPFRHEDYYKFMAFFNNTRDEDTYDEYPLIRHFNEKNSLQLAALKEWVEQNASAAQAERLETFVKTWQPSVNSLTSDRFHNSELADTKWLRFRNNAHCRLPGAPLEGHRIMVYRYKSPLPGGRWTIHLDTLDGPVLAIVNVPDTDNKWVITELQIPEIRGTHDLYLTYSNPNLQDPNAGGMMLDWFHFTDPLPEVSTADDSKYRKIFHALLTAATSTTPIQFENPPAMQRKTHVFERGNWLSTGNEVQPDIPAILPPMPESAPKNRLGLAMWMTDPDNPLTARTIVNRLWYHLFGRGIVETLEDLGTQGAQPTHRKLLDHLSWKFMHNYNWSIKQLLREIVLSDTYRRSTVASDEQRNADPYNLYYLSGARVRLSAEQIRDQALAASGLLSKKMYGPSTMPYQPDGTWMSPYNGQEWQQSEGEDRYRRAVYTYWKRTAPYPSMVAFDMMPREVCTTRRINTNTPLQALVTLNDPAFVEAAGHLAQRMEAEGGTMIRDKINYGYRLLMFRDMADTKIDVLQRLYNESLQQSTVASASEASATNIPSPDTAMLVVANTLLNLDEVLTKN
jgi:mono/diheme cytochrome c family protein